MTSKEILNKVRTLEAEAKGGKNKRDIKRRALQIKLECLQKLGQQGGKERLQYYAALDRAETLLL